MIKKKVGGTLRPALAVVVLLVAFFVGAVYLFGVAVPRAAARLGVPPERPPETVAIGDFGLAEIPVAPMLPGGHTPMSHQQTAVIIAIAAIAILAAVYDRRRSRRQ